MRTLLRTSTDQDLTNALSRLVRSMSDIFSRTQLSARTANSLSAAISIYQFRRIDGSPRVVITRVV